MFLPRLPVYKWLFKLFSQFRPIIARVQTRKLLLISRERALDFKLCLSRAL